MSVLQESLVCAAFNALCFFLMYRIFSAQVDMLEMKMREWRKEMREFKRDMRVQIGVAHQGIGMRWDDGRYVDAAERSGAGRCGIGSG
jgi:hypothetical protein